MKLALILLLSLPLLAFEGKQLYQCSSMYRLVNGSPHEFSKEEQEKSTFGLMFNQNKNKVKTSDGMVYAITKSSVKGALYSNKVKVNGRTLYYKLKMAGENGLYKSVSVSGYGNLINEFVMCKKMHKDISDKSK